MSDTGLNTSDLAATASSGTPGVDQIFNINSRTCYLLMIGTLVSTGSAVTADIEISHTPNASDMQSK